MNSESLCVEFCAGSLTFPPSSPKIQFSIFSDQARYYENEKHISGRQREVLQLFAEGKSMKEIAFILGLKPGTVAFHKYKMMDSLGIKTNAGLIEYAIKHHLVLNRETGVLTRVYH